MKAKLKAALQSALRWVGGLDIRDVIGSVGLCLVAGGVAHFSGAVACITVGCALIAWTIFAVRR